MNNKRVSVICCHKDYKKYLPYAVESFEDQTYKNCRLCVIDDGSSMNINEVSSLVFKRGEIEFTESLGEYTVVSGPNKILIYLSKNLGPSEARNIGIKYLWDTSDAFLILDADDQMFENKVEVFVNEMKKDWDNIGVVYSDYMIVDEETNVVKMEYKKPYDKTLLNTECIVHSGALINKIALDKCGLYDSTLRTCEDFNLWLRISKKFIIKHIAEFLTIVLNHKNNSTYSVSTEVWQENFKRAIKNEG
jgi:glycosyltransferase involved in cell wall biosynthesis